MLKGLFNKQSFWWHQLDLHNSKFYNSRDSWALFFDWTWGMKGYMYEIILSRIYMAGVFLQNSEWLWSLVIRVGKLSESSFRSVFSLTKQPTFRDATTGFPAKWRLRNKCRNSILMMRHYPGLGGASDWLCSVGNLLQPIRSPMHPGLGSDTSSEWNFCSHFSDVISRGTNGGVTKCQLFSQASLFSHLNDPK